MLNRKEWERDRGFLVHVSMVYPVMTPYLKGLHLTMEMWRSDRDSQGWKLPRNDSSRFQIHLQDKGLDYVNLSSDSDHAPEMVKRAPRLLNDLCALNELLSDEHPPIRVVRSKALRATCVSFVDASGLGKGASTIGNNRNVSTFYAKDIKNSGESSNFREFNNLVETLEREHHVGNLRNLEVFVCTDNEVAEKAFYKGSSKSPKLFNLVLKLRKLQLYGNFKLHVVHVAGSRMIEQGTDGLSRGIPYEGHLGQQKNFLNYLPLHLDPCERYMGLKTWLKAWLPAWTRYLTPNDWFELGHDVISWSRRDILWHPKTRTNVCVWTPAPASAYKAVEQLRIARHKRQASTHVFITPRLLTCMWRSNIHKVADLVVEIPADLSYWSTTMH